MSTRIGTVIMSFMLATLVMRGGPQAAVTAPSVASAAESGAEDLVPKDLDTTPLDGPHSVTDRVVYLGKENRKISKVVTEDGATYELHGRRGGTKYQGLRFEKGRDRFFRIEDKKGNKIIDWKMEDRIEPIIADDADLFAVPGKIGTHGDNEPVRGGLRFYDMNGKVIGEVDPSATGRIRILKVSNDGIALVNALKGDALVAYDRTGKKLWEVGTLPDSVELSPDGKYFFTRRAFSRNMKDFYDGSLFDMKGNELLHIEDLRELAPRFLAFSTDSRFVGYTKAIPNTRRGELRIIEINTGRTMFVLPDVRSTYIAISEGACYVAQVKHTPYKTSTGQLLKYELWLQDKGGTLVGNYSLGEQLAGRVKHPKFLNSNLLALEGEDGWNQYFRVAEAEKP